VAEIIKDALTINKTTCPTCGCENPKANVNYLICCDNCFEVLVYNQGVYEVAK